jgi:hypothetical protein
MPMVVRQSLYVNVSRGLVLTPRLPPFNYATEDKYEAMDVEKE